LQVPNKPLRLGPESLFYVLHLNYPARQRYMFDLANLVRRDHKILAAYIT